jgi:hypothetical protein
MILLISVLLIYGLLKSVCIDIYDNMKKGHGIVFSPPRTSPHTLTSV